MRSIQNDGNLSHGGVQNISPSSVAGALSDASKPSPVSTEEDLGNSAAPTMAMATALAPAKAKAKAKAPAPVLKIVQDRNAAKARYGAKVIGKLLKLAEKMSVSDAKEYVITNLAKYKVHEEQSTFLQEWVLKPLVETMKTELAKDDQLECDRILQEIRQMFNNADPSTAIRQELARLKPIIEVTIVEGATKASTAVINRMGTQKTFSVKNKRNQEDFQSQYEKIVGPNAARIFHKVGEGGASIFQTGDDLAPYRTYGFNSPAEKEQLMEYVVDQITLAKKLPEDSELKAFLAKQFEQGNLQGDSQILMRCLYLCMQNDATHPITGSFETDFEEMSTFIEWLEGNKARFGGALTTTLQDDLMEKQSSIYHRLRSSSEKESFRYLHQAKLELDGKMERLESEVKEEESEVKEEETVSTQENVKRIKDDLAKKRDAYRSEFQNNELQPFLDSKYWSDFLKENERLLCELFDKKASDIQELEFGSYEKQLGDLEAKLNRKELERTNQPISELKTKLSSDSFETIQEAVEIVIAQMDQLNLESVQELLDILDPNSEVEYKKPLHSGLKRELEARKKTLEAEQLDKLKRQIGESRVLSAKLKAFTEKFNEEKETKPCLDAMEAFDVISSEINQQLLLCEFETYDEAGLDGIEKYKEELQTLQTTIKVSQDNLSLLMSLEKQLEDSLADWGKLEVLKLEALYSELSKVTSLSTKNQRRKDILEEHIQCLIDKKNRSGSEKKSKTLETLKGQISDRSVAKEKVNTLKANLQFEETELREYLNEKIYSQINGDYFELLEKVDDVCQAFIQLETEEPEDYTVKYWLRNMLLLRQSLFKSKLAFKEGQKKEKLMTLTLPVTGDKRLPCFKEVREMLNCAVGGRYTEKEVSDKLDHLLEKKGKLFWEKQIKMGLALGQVSAEIVEETGGGKTTFLELLAEVADFEHKKLHVYGPIEFCAEVQEQEVKPKLKTDEDFMVEIIDLIENPLNYAGHRFFFDENKLVFAIQDAKEIKCKIIHEIISYDELNEDQRKEIALKIMACPDSWPSLYQAVCDVMNKSAPRPQDQIKVAYWSATIATDEARLKLIATAREEDKKLVDCLKGLGESIKDDAQLEVALNTIEAEISKPTNQDRLWQHQLRMLHLNLKKFKDSKTKINQMIPAARKQEIFQNKGNYICTNVTEPCDYPGYPMLNVKLETEKIAGWEQKQKFQLQLAAEMWEEIKAKVSLADEIETSSSSVGEAQVTTLNFSSDALCKQICDALSDDSGFLMQCSEKASTGTDVGKKSRHFQAKPVVSVLMFKRGMTAEQWIQWNGRVREGEAIVVVLPEGMSEEDFFQELQRMQASMAHVEGKDYTSLIEGLKLQADLKFLEGLGDVSKGNENIEHAIACLDDVVRGRFNSEKSKAEAIAMLKNTFPVRLLEAKISKEMGTKISEKGQTCSEDETYLSIVERVCSDLVESLTPKGTMNKAAQDVFLLLQGQDASADYQQVLSKFSREESQIRESYMKDLDEFMKDINVLICKTPEDNAILYRESKEGKTDDEKKLIEKQQAENEPLIIRDYKSFQTSFSEQLLEKFQDSDKSALEISQSIVETFKQQRWVAASKFQKDQPFWPNYVGCDSSHREALFLKIIHGRIRNKREELEDLARAGNKKMLCKVLTDSLKLCPILDDARGNFLVGLNTTVFTQRNLASQQQGNIPDEYQHEGRQFDSVDEMMQSFGQDAWTTLGPLIHSGLSASHEEGTVESASSNTASRPKPPPILDPLDADDESAPASSVSSYVSLTESPRENWDEVAAESDERSSGSQSSVSESVMSDSQSSVGESVMSDPQSSVGESVRLRGTSVDESSDLEELLRLRSQCRRRFLTLKETSNLKKSQCTEIKRRLNRKWILDGNEDNERLDVVNKGGFFDSGTYFYESLEYHIKHAIYQEFYQDFLSVTEKFIRGR